MKLVVRLPLEFMRGGGAKNTLRRPVRSGQCNSHHRYVHGLRTKEVILIRKLAANMDKSLTDLVQQVGITKSIGYKFGNGDTPPPDV